MRLTSLGRVIPNAIVRSKGDKSTYVGHEIEGCRDFSSLHFRLPFEKVCAQSCIYSSCEAVLKTRRVILSIGMRRRLSGMDCSMRNISEYVSVDSHYWRRTSLKTQTIGGPDRFFAFDDRAIFQSAESPGRVRSIRLRGIRIPVVLSMHP